MKFDRNTLTQDFIDMFSLNFPQGFKHIRHKNDYLMTLVNDCVYTYGPSYLVSCAIHTSDHDYLEAIIHLYFEMPWNNFQLNKKLSNTLIEKKITTKTHKI